MTVPCPKFPTGWSRLPALWISNCTITKASLLDLTRCMVCNALLEKPSEIMREKRAAIYVRVSTSEQDTGLQETESRQYVESRGWEYIVYRDTAQSGLEE